MINMCNCKGFKSHRSGWSYALNSLKGFHSSGGIYLDDFLERSFGWEYDKIFKNNDRQIPYCFPWVGFIHNPPNHPLWFDFHNSVHKLLENIFFKESLKSCLGIFTLSKYLADFLEDKINKPIYYLYHPTELIVPKFEMYNFIKNKTVVQLGYWLRKMYSITEIKRTDYKLEWLPSDYEYAKTKLRDEQTFMGDHWYNSNKKWKNIFIHKFISNDDFDQKISQSIVLCNLYDSSANNTIIECIARETPIIINRLPATEEYLGADYPMFIDGPIDQMLDDDRIWESHIYLKNINKDKIDKRFFVRDFEKCVQLLV